MEVSAVPSNPNHPEGGDYENRDPNMSQAATTNDPRGDYYAAPPRYHNYDHPPQQYLPHEREFVTSHRSCSHCQTHCCQRPTEYQNQPSGSRGERLERYVGTVRNEPAPVATEPIRESFSRTSVSPGQGEAYNPGSCNDHVKGPPVLEQERNVNAYPASNQAAECSSPPPDQQPVEIATQPHDSSCCSHHQEQSNCNDPHRNQTVSCPPSRAPSVIESPFLAKEKYIEPTNPAIPPPRRSDHIIQSDPTTCPPMLNSTQSLPVLRCTKQESVASLMVASTPSQSAICDEGESQKFSPNSLTHLNFKEKQLAMSAIKKAAMNMSCLNMFQDKDKHNCGKIGKRDFQMVMDRIGVLRGMSSREIDAVFKGFSTHSDTEIDYKKFSAACRHAVDNDYRLARMAQK